MYISFKYYKIQPFCLIYHLWTKQDLKKNATHNNNNNLKHKKRQIKKLQNSTRLANNYFRFYENK